VRRLSIGRLLLAGALVLAAVSSATAAGAQSDGGSGATTTTAAGGGDSGGAITCKTTDPIEGVDPGFVDVVELSGLLDPVLADVLTRAIASANAEGAIALVVRVNSTQAVISESEVVDLGRAIADSKVPVTFWIGPSGAKAEGRVAQLVALGDDVGIAPGSRIGKLGEQVLGPEFGPGFGDKAAGLRETTVGANDAASLGIARVAPTLGSFVVCVDGFQSRLDPANQSRRLPVTQTRIAGLSLGNKLFHTVASPAVAYLLFLIGMALLVFELFTAGVGIAGVVGAVCFVLGCYGLDVLPARGWAVALLVLAMFGYSVDIQTGVPRLWTGLATAFLVVGSVALYDGVGLSWVTLVAGLGGITLAMVAGMPAMVRTRFSTPTIGREWMIGETGVAVGAVDPDGVVKVRDALWKARTNRATPIADGEAVRVTELQGLIVEVEPLAGAARDYREARDRNGPSDPGEGGES